MEASGRKTNCKYMPAAISRVKKTGCCSSCNKEIVQCNVRLHWRVGVGSWLLTVDPLTSGTQGQPRCTLMWVRPAGDVWHVDIADCMHHVRFMHGTLVDDAVCRSFTRDEAAARYQLPQLRCSRWVWASKTSARGDTKVGILLVVSAHF